MKFAAVFVTVLAYLGYLMAVLALPFIIIWYLVTH